MDSVKVYLLWALGVGGVAWVVSGLVSVGLVLALRGLVPMPPWLWVVARGLLIASWVCFGATVVLLATGLSRRFREWVEGSVGRCGRWIRGLF